MPVTIADLIQLTGGSVVVAVAVYLILRVDSIKLDITFGRFTRRRGR